MEIATAGIDLGKSSFHLVGLSQQGHVVVRKKLSRPHLVRFLATRHPCRVGMEACSGAHFLGRQLRDHGHDVRLMPPQYVRPFVKGNKNDFLDAEAIAEAVQRPTMRFVPLKTPEQLDLQAFHRVRARRTALINQIRAFLRRPWRSVMPRSNVELPAHLSQGLLPFPSPAASRPAERRGGARGPRVGRRIT